MGAVRCAGIISCVGFAGISKSRRKRARRRCRLTARQASARATDARKSRRLEIIGDDFVLDGKKHQFISGSVSYFRVLPEQWLDRLTKLKALGCNAAEVYVPWNLHEPEPGHFCFDGRRDLPRFLNLCWELGLDVLLRPGPYICAEWDFGGLPWWLLDAPDPVPLRSSDPRYLQKVEAWWLGELFPKMQPFLACNGGPVVAVQIENEFGYWGRDPAYLESLSDMAQRGLGPECPLLFTSDGTFQPDLQVHGGVRGALRTANFGSNPDARLQELRAAQPSGPLFNMEFWVGWFDPWGAVAGKSYREAGDVAETLQGLLRAGASVNFFVFHGGTSFGFCGAGGNLSVSGEYEPQVTSYDYGGLLDEAGEVTEKYLRCREVIADFLGKPELLQNQFPRAQRLPAPLELDLNAFLSFEDALPLLARETVNMSTPVPAEHLGCGYGYVFYRAALPPDESLPLEIGDDAVRDFASVMVDGEVLGTIYRNDKGLGRRSFTLPPKGKRVEILVDMMGRVNFGQGMRSERKGLVGPSSVVLGSLVTIPRRALQGWECITLPMSADDLARLPWPSPGGRAQPSRRRGPSFFRYELHVVEPADGFLALDGFRKGFVCVNGFNLGRYWEVGPQRSLYLPAPLLRRGRNEVIVFDIDSPGRGLPSLRVEREARWSSGRLPAGVREAMTDAVAQTTRAASGVEYVLKQVLGGS